MKLWQRHILSQLTQTFSFLLFSLFSIYLIADLSVHGIRFYGKTTLFELTFYYLCTFSVLLDLFLSLAFLLATLRLLFHLNSRGELVALQMAGLSKKRLLSPFFLFASLLCALSYFNSQKFAPQARERLDTFTLVYKPHKKKNKPVHVYSLSLSDDSELVYQSFEAQKNELFDVFWVRNPNDIWHMKSLQIDPLIGHFVHHFTRNEKKQLQKTESLFTKDFTNMPWDKEAILHKFVPYDQRSISTLLSQAGIDSAERSCVLTHLYYKLLIPLIPLLSLFIIAPFCLRFSRSRPLLLIAALSLFGLIALKVIFDGMLILGETQVLPPLLAIGAPLALLFFFSAPSFVRMQ